MQSTNANQTIKVGLVQINNSFSGQDYLPLSIGMLQAYAQKHLHHPEKYEFMLPVHRRIPVEQAVEQLLGADVAFFSTYVWNFNISMEIAKNLKSSTPETLIVFGGPHVPERIEGFFEKYPFVDLACNGEGEQVALGILENVESRDWENVPGINFLAKDGTLQRNRPAVRIKDMSTVPSPYLDGVFKPLMEATPDAIWIALWETNRGCPFSCTFCDWGSAVQSKVNSYDMERLDLEIGWFAEHRIDYIMCCDANFGILARDIDIVKHVAEAKRKYGFPEALSVQNTKNATERAYIVQKTLADAGLNRGVDIAIQSLDTNTLESIKRANISLDTYKELQRRFVRDGVETYTDMILGLPGDTYDTYVDGVSTLIENGQHNRMQLNNLSILPNSEMGDPEYQKKYGMVTVESRPVQSHGLLPETDLDVPELQLLVIATNTMPKEDWVRIRVFSWMISLLHFDKIIQIPLVLAHQAGGVSYRDLLEAFTEEPLDGFPVLDEIRELLIEKARGIQAGGPEYMHSKEWLNIWWFLDEYLLIKLVVESKLTEFFQEAEELLNRVLRANSANIPPDALHEAFILNQSLIKLPFQTEDLTVELSYNLWEVYQSGLIDGNVDLEHKTSVYQIDRSSVGWSSLDDWFQQVVWYGNKRGQYLYGNNLVRPQLAGHF